MFLLVVGGIAAGAQALTSRLTIDNSTVNTLAMGRWATAGVVLEPTARRDRRPTMTRLVLAGPLRGGDRLLLDQTSQDRVRVSRERRGVAIRPGLRARQRPARTRITFETVSSTAARLAADGLAVPRQRVGASVCERRAVVSDARAPARSTCRSSINRTTAAIHDLCVVQQRQLDSGERYSAARRRDGRRRREVLHVAERILQHRCDRDVFEARGDDQPHCRFRN